LFVDIYGISGQPLFVTGDLVTSHRYAVSVETCDKLLGLKLNADACHPRAERAVWIDLGGPSQAG